MSHRPRPARPDWPPGLDEAVEQVLTWYDAAARDLPWRRPGTTAWGVLVSEVMLQQTPVVRVLPAWVRWLERWPAPAFLAADTAGDAVRAWDRLGYPRRALRLHAAAVACVERHDGAVPADLDALLALPGVGAYTARAVAAFAYGQRQAVVDTNVRRLATRAFAGAADAPAGSAARDLALVEPLLPDDPARAVRLSAGLMELGQLVCTARRPRCEECPLARSCAWQRAGRPPYAGPPRTVQGFAGTDRQVRGLLLAAVRAATGPVEPAVLDRVWPDAVQRERALAGLRADGLLTALADGRHRLGGVAG